MSRKNSPIAIRGLLIFSGAAIILVGIFTLGDGEATIGISGRTIQSSTDFIHINTWLELLLMSTILFSVSFIFILAGVAPQKFDATPIVSILVIIVFLLMVSVPLLINNP